jgi:nucleoside-diphosphate-sugar epimerase
MSPFKNVLLIGASGLIGTAIQAELLAKKTSFFKLGALTASNSAPNPKKDAYWESLAKQGVQIVKVDFSDTAALVKAFTGSIHPNCSRFSNMLKVFLIGWDAVISALGLPMVKVQLNMIGAAAEAGVKRFLPSEYGFDLTIPSNRQEKVYAMKIAVADKLKEVSEKHPGFTYTLLAVGSSLNSSPHDATGLTFIQGALRRSLSWFLPCMTWILKAAKHVLLVMGKPQFLLPASPSNLESPSSTV